MADQSDRTSRSSEPNKKSESVHINISFFVRDFELQTPIFRNKVSNKLFDLHPFVRKFVLRWHRGCPKTRIFVGSIPGSKR